MANFNETIDDLKDRLLDINEQVQVIQAAADADKRDFSEDESTQVDALFAEFEHTEKEIERRSRIDAQTHKLMATLDRQTDPDSPEPQNRARDADSGSVARRNPRITMSEDRGKWGWRHIGEFAAAVRVASRHPGNADPRLMQNAPTTVSQEGVGADGGFAVPPDFRESIMEKVMGEESLLGRTDQMTTSSNNLTFPKDETTPWQSSGGVQAYWDGENHQLSQSKVALKEETIKLNKLTALIPVTEELLEDAPSLDSYLRRKVPQKFDWKIQDAIINGTGVGMPQGVLNSDCLVSVAKDTSTSPIQPADTIRYKNIVDMYSRLYAPSRANSIWLINQDVEPSLQVMDFDPTATSKTPVYLPANGAAGQPYASLMGRPVVPIEACQTLGDKGDIILADLSQYMSVVKTGGIRQDVSIHLWFDYDTAAYRFIMRLGGQPWWASAITPANGSNTRSCFVTLDERA